MRKHGNMLVPRFVRWIIATVDVLSLRAERNIIGARPFILSMNSCSEEFAKLSTLHCWWSMKMQVLIPFSTLFLGSTPHMPICYGLKYTLAALCEGVIWTCLILELGEGHNPKIWWFKNWGCITFIHYDKSMTYNHWYATSAVSKTPNITRLPIHHYRKPLAGLFRQE